MAKNNDVSVWGGIGELNSNNGTQFYFQNRIYDSRKIAPSLSHKFRYWIVIFEEDGE